MSDMLIGALALRRALASATPPLGLEVRLIRLAGVTGSPAALPWSS